MRPLPQGTDCDCRAGRHLTILAIIDNRPVQAHRLQHRVQQLAPHGRQTARPGGPPPLPALRRRTSSRPWGCRRRTRFAGDRKCSAQALQAATLLRSASSSGGLEATGTGARASRPRASDPSCVGRRRPRGRLRALYAIARQLATPSAPSRRLRPSTQEDRACAPAESCFPVP